MAAVFVTDGGDTHVADCYPCITGKLRLIDMTVKQSKLNDNLSYHDPRNWHILKSGVTVLQVPRTDSLGTKEAGGI